MYESKMWTPEQIQALDPALFQQASYLHRFSSGLHERRNYTFIRIEDMPEMVTVTVDNGVYTFPDGRKFAQVKGDACCQNISVGYGVGQSFARVTPTICFLTEIEA